VEAQDKEEIHFREGFQIKGKNHGKVRLQMDHRKADHLKADRQREEETPTREEIRSR
jgi:hypothetical protein